MTNLTASPDLITAEADKDIPLWNGRNWVDQSRLVLDVTVDSSCGPDEVIVPDEPGVPWAISPDQYVTRVERFGELSVLCEMIVRIILSKVSASELDSEVEVVAMQVVEDIIVADHDGRTVDPDVYADVMAILPTRRRGMVVSARAVSRMVGYLAATPLHRRPARPIPDILAGTTWGNTRTWTPRKKR